MAKFEDETKINSHTAGSQNEVLHLFLDLVKIDSPSGKEQNVATFVEQFIQKKLGVETIRDEHNNVFARLPGTGEALLFNAHLDTVQPGESIKPVVIDGWVKSDGTTILGADDKSAVAAILHAATQITKVDPANRRPMEILFTTSEETGNYGAIGFDKSHITAKEGFIFDATFPVGTVISGSPYYARFDVVLRGKAGHAGYPDKAIPTIPSMLTISGKIEELRTKELLINIGVLKGGTARNTIIGELEMHGEIRTFTEQLFTDAMSKLDTMLKSEYPVQVESDIVVENPGYVHDDTAVERVQTTISTILGRMVEAKKTYGVSDGNLLNSENLSVYTLGYGSTGAHTVNETISVQALEEMSLIIQKMILPRK